MGCSKKHIGVMVQCPQTFGHAVTYIMGYELKKNVVNFDINVFIS